MNPREDCIRSLGQFPAITRIECICLEKLRKYSERNGYFYLNVAEGGRPVRLRAIPSSVRVAAARKARGSSPL